MIKGLFAGAGKYRSPAVIFVFDEKDEKYHRLL